MRYLAWTLLALVTYSFVPPLMGATTTRVSTPVATFVGAGMLSATGLALALANGDPLTQSVTEHWLYVFGTGIVLTVGVFSFVNALSMGPVSVVTPIFGLFLVISSIVGAVFFGESLTLQRIAGMGFAVLAILLISFE